MTNFGIFLLCYFVISVAVNLFYAGRGKGFFETTGNLIATAIVHGLFVVLLLTVGTGTGV